MVSWYADGGISGFSLAYNTTNVLPESGPSLTQDVIKLATAGTVDAEGITRLNILPTGDPNSQYLRPTLDGMARLRFTTAENNAAVAANKFLGATMVVVKASQFAAGVKPTPAQILAAPAEAQAATHTTTPGAANTNYEIPLPGPLLQPNTKYWALVYPSTFLLNSAPGPYGGDSVVGGDINVVGRAVSMWGNRMPLAPVITSPPTDSVFGSGAEFDLTFTPKDPDRFSGAISGANQDKAGVQVQYAPRPTSANPNPVWTDLPITDINGSTGSGWWIDRSTQSSPSSEVSSGAFLFWINQTMKVRGGPPGLAAASVQKGALPAGNWQIRVRTFDYGHPYPRWLRPLNVAANLLTPDYYQTNYPLDVSPWSTPVNVTVSEQVLKPVPLSPVDSVAIPEDTSVTLYWRYRNTYSPPYPQKGRTVQIRKAGDPDWTVAVSGNSADPSYNLDSPAPPIPPTPVQYLADPGFEGGTTGNWLTTSTASPALLNVNDPPTAHSGSRYLRLNTTTTVNPLIYQFVNLAPGDQFFSWSGWIQRGNTDQQVVGVYFVDDANTQLSFYTRLVGGLGAYNYVEIVDMPRPAGATKVLMQITNVKSSGSITGVSLDDMSFVGSPQPPSTPIPVYNPIYLEALNQYEWRVQTTDASGTVSPWSDVATFWVVPLPASGPVRPLPTGTIDGATLGCGTHRVYVYRRGGRERVGELTGLSYVDWGRMRDDISDARIVVSSWDIDCGNLLKSLQTWAYEIVIYRDNGFTVDRVWEGPITLLTYQADKVIISAKDVVAYLYRRIIKQAMNDTGTSATKGDSVVGRATRVIQNVMAPDDPNVLSYLQPLPQDDDAKQYRNTPAWSRTAYEEIDDMAANAGLDYTAVGRSILLWGTKHRIGTLPEFRDENLGNLPIVSEYGMSAANVYSISDGNGTHGEANRLNTDGGDPIYGLVEMLSSSWASDSEADSGTYTQEGLETVRESFKQSAEKSIASKYPPPVVVRVPDNTTLFADTVLSIQQLVPGVVIPLRSNATLRPVAANQKLDSIKVTETNGTEVIQVTMSPFSRDDNVAPEGEE